MPSPLAAITARIRALRETRSYRPRHGYPFTIDSHEAWRQRLRAQYPLAFTEPSPVADVTWVDALFDRWLFGDDSMAVSFHVE